MIVLNRVLLFLPLSGSFNIVPTARLGRTELFGTNRKARRLEQKQQNRSRSKLLDELESTKKPKKKKKRNTDDADDAKEEKINDMAGMAKGNVIQAETTDRPEISTVVIDEDTGIEKIAQGKAVMDVITRRAVELSALGPEYRLAQMFPGVNPETREEVRFRNFEEMDVMEMVSKLKEACMVPLTNQETGEVEEKIPPHPSVSQKGIDFVLANREYLGFRMSKLLGRLKLRAQSKEEKELASSYRNLWKHFITLEDHISAPFRQMLLDAEATCGPNFGNVDLKSFIGLELYERCATYVVLKGMVAHWEKKVLDADFVEKTPQTRGNYMEVLATGDPKRYLPNSPIIFRLDEVTRVCAAAQQMVKTFVEDETLFADLPPELRFIDGAFTMVGGTALRKYMIDFCDNENITPVALREGIRRFEQQMENLQIDPYGDLKNKITRLSEALSMGSGEEVNPYKNYLYNLNTNGPGFFQTYTADHHQNSMVRFLDQATPLKEGTFGPNNVGNVLSNEFSVLTGVKVGGEKISKTDYDGSYFKPPQRRTLGRPHDLGWLDLLNDEIPMPENDNNFDSDNWKEVSE